MDFRDLLTFAGFLVLGCLLSAKVVRLLPNIGLYSVVYILDFPVDDVLVVVRVLPTFLLIEFVDVPLLLTVRVMRLFEPLGDNVVRFDQLAIRGTHPLL